MPKKDEPKTIEALSRGLRVLSVLGQSPAPLRNVEIVSQLENDPDFEFSPNAVSRILSALLAEGYVQKAEQNARNVRWSTTAKVMDLAKQFAHKF